MKRNREMTKVSTCTAWTLLTVSLLLAACGGGGGGGATTPPPVVHSGGYVISFGIAVDRQRDVYVAGYTDGGLDGNALVGQHDMFVTMYDATGKKVRTRELGAAGGHVHAYGVAVDAQGNVFVGGETDVGLDGNVVIGVLDAFLTKFDSAGNKIKTIEFGVAGKQTSVHAIAVDSGGNVYVAGSTNSGSNSKIPSQKGDLFYSKYDNSGNLVLTRQLGTADTFSIASAITIDSSGNVYLVGTTNAGLDGNSLTGLLDMFVTSYDITGTRVWTKQGGVAGAITSAVGISLDGAGHVLVVGTTAGGLDGNTQTGTRDLFFTTYDASGNRLRTRQLGTAGKDTLVGGIGVDSHDYAYVVGGTYGGLDGNTPTGPVDAFITQFDNNGAKVRTVQFGVAGGTTGATAIAVDNLNNLHLSGTTTGALDGNSFVGLQDSFYTMFDSSGNKIRTKEFGVPVI
jgi:hypothetical protein